MASIGAVWAALLLRDGRFRGAGSVAAEAAAARSVSPGAVTTLTTTLSSFAAGTALAFSRRKLS
jgi:hypothetical protein